MIYKKELKFLKNHNGLNRGGGFLFFLFGELFVISSKYVFLCNIVYIFLL